MISLSLPKESENFHATIFSFIVGPFNLHGSTNDDVISSRADMDFLAQGARTFHENDVKHGKADGNLRYYPLWSDLVHSPTYNYPNQCTVRVRNSRNGQYKTITSYHGLAYPGAYSLWRSSAWEHYFVESVGPGSMTLWTYRVPSSRWDKPYIRKDEISFKPHPTTSGMIEISYTPYMWLSSDFTDEIRAIDWKTVRSFADLAILKSVTVPMDRSPTQVIATDAYTSLGKYTFSVKDAEKLIQAQVRYLKEAEMPLEWEHFGNLAMSASEKVNANSVNMIAFLKDIRRPQELIPKLKNLSKLKTLADNHLTVQYGVLPTIDDLKSIYEALAKVKPYYDRNGFKTYSSGYRDSKDIDNLSYSIEQHLKIAIADEDSGLADIVNRLESAGFLLTLENTWDLVPYSFVIDWFVDIGGALERLDTRMRIARLNIRYVTMSQKRTITRFLNPGSGLPMAGTVSWVHYQRWTSDQCPVPPLSLEVTPRVQNHWLEAGALLVQRKK